MDYKLGIVGHSSNIKRVMDVIEMYFEDISAYPLELVSKDQIEDTVSFLYSYENLFDGVIFTGKIPYDVINLTMYHKVPWYYLEHSSGQLKSALLEALIIHGYDITKISIDSFDGSVIESTYNEIGLAGNQLSYFLAKVDLAKYTMLLDIEDFHENNYRNGLVSFCITGITSIHDSLISKGIPSILLKPTEEIIKKTLYDARSNIANKLINDAQYAFVSIEIDQASEYSLIYDNEYKYFIEKNKVSEKVFAFAQSIQGAALEFGRKSYIIFF